eukprot:TRINITY_DN55906_c0_g1_i1.p1 TRINITY_DN55906_c0_g1~~TRINITY_DN55906_c0_g1_i1.p1  ORF type:complete len:1118 (+),score=206.72 TRINITY_DN55906_c0_g1_i1:67-3420(+)
MYTSGNFQPQSGFGTPSRPPAFPAYPQGGNAGYSQQSPGLPRATATSRRAASAGAVTRSPAANPAASQNYYTGRRAPPPVPAGWSLAAGHGHVEPPPQGTPLQHPSAASQTRQPDSYAAFHHNGHLGQLASVATPPLLPGREDAAALMVPPASHSHLQVGGSIGRTFNGAASLASAATALEGVEEMRALQQVQLANHMSIAGPLCGSARHDPKGRRDWVKRWWQTDFEPVPALDLNVMHGVVSSLASSPGTILKSNFVGRVLADGAAALRAADYGFRSVNYLKIPQHQVDAGEEHPPRVVVVGDTHGQLEDVLWIFQKHGLPSRSNVYLFNGDIVDRGSHGLEIFTLALGFMVTCPGSVHINRGNHEDEFVNKSGCGGFYMECLQKYGGSVGGAIYDQMLEVYTLLPLATVLDQKVFVVHGGLSRASNFFALLESIQQRQSHVRMDLHDARNWALVDALWSDPMDNLGIQPSFRGANIFQFGPDITQRFLSETGFSMVVRSHEVPPNNDGVYTMHGGKLMTVFSASNYRGSQMNQGAVLLFTEAGGRVAATVSRHLAPPISTSAYRQLLLLLQKPAVSAHRRPATDLQNGHTATPGFVSYAAPQAQAGHPTGAAAKHQALLEMEKRAAEEIVSQARATDGLLLKKHLLKDVAQLVVQHKPALWAFLFSRDPENRGYVSLIDFRCACKAILGNLPWGALEPLLLGSSMDSSQDAGGLQVDYLTFLNRFRVVLLGSEVSENFSESLLSILYANLLQHDLSLRAVMKEFDRDGNGTVTVQELKEALTSHSIGITEQQAAALMRTIAAHASTNSRDPAGGVNIDSFLARFEMVYRPLAHRQQNPGEGIRWVSNALNRIGRCIWTTPNRESSAVTMETSAGHARAFFEKADRNGNGVLDRSEFMLAIAELAVHSGLPSFSEMQLRALAEAVDISQDGQISYLEFLKGFAPNDVVMDKSFQTDIMEHICTTIWANKPALLSACLRFDRQHTSKVTREELSSVLRAMNMAVDTCSHPLTDEQIQTLMDHTKFEVGSDKVDYHRFLNSFQVVDVAAPPDELLEVAQLADGKHQWQLEAGRDEAYRSAAVLMLAQSFLLGLVLVVSATWVILESSCQYQVGRTNMG